jgi:hypothetical protein
MPTNKTFKRTTNPCGQTDKTNKLNTDKIYKDELFSGMKSIGNNDMPSGTGTGNCQK